jgi:hypothetical protein
MCFRKTEVNYYLYGVATRLCGHSYKVNAGWIWFWKKWQDENDASDTLNASRRFYKAGYDGKPIAGSALGPSDRPHCAPCKLKASSEKWTGNLGENSVGKKFRFGPPWGVDDD